MMRINSPTADCGREERFDFRAAEPRLPVPPALDAALRELLEGEDSVRLHGYTPAPGLPDFRSAIAADLQGRLGVPVAAAGVYVCCGAAAGLAACCRGLLCPGEEALVLAPEIPALRAYVEGAGGVLRGVAPDAALRPDWAALERALSEKTALVFVNSPNLRSGVVLTAEELARLAALLEAAQRRVGHPIYLVSDEACRELVPDGTLPPSPLCFYDNSVLSYSFSESLSMPGERLGYLAVSERMADGDAVFAALAGAARACGYVNAPSLLQRAVQRCLGLTGELSLCRENCALLERGLRASGFDCLRPDSAFCLVMKSPEPDAKAFAARAAQFGLLLTPGDDFGPGAWLRLSTCVPADTVRRALPAFRALAESCGLQ